VTMRSSSTYFRIGEERRDLALCAGRVVGCEMSNRRDDQDRGVGKRLGRDLSPAGRCDGVEAARQNEGWNGAARSRALRQGPLVHLPSAAVIIHIGEVHRRALERSPDSLGKRAALATVRRIRSRKVPTHRI
jgi:hypothetical protein